MVAHRSRSRPRFAPGLAVALIATSVGSLPAQENAPVPAGTAFLYPERIPLQDGTFAAAERGVVFVPVNRSRPGGPTIGIEVYRFRGPTPGAPPIFQLPGGPGFPGLAPQLANSGYYERAIRPWVEMADLVVVGQRGIGSSPPNTTCEGPAPLPLGAAVTEADETARLRDALRRCRTFWEGTGLDLSGFTVIEAAADVDDVRRALGYARIVVQGTSFGSHWGMAVLRYHPEIVERAILSGMEGSDHTYDSPTGVLNAFRRVAAEAATAPAFAGKIPPEGLLESFQAAIARAERQPVMVALPNPRSAVPDTVRFDGRQLRSLAYGYTGPASSRAGLASWPADLLALASGRLDQAAAALARRRERQSSPTASFFMLDCGSGISPKRDAVLAADPAVRVLGDINDFYRAACPVWNSDLGEGFRSGFDTTIPTVIVQGNWDTSTPIENALELAPRFKRSTFVTVNRGSHGALREALQESTPFRAALTRFVRTGDLTGFPTQVDLPPVVWVEP